MKSLFAVITVQILLCCGSPEKPKSIDNKKNSNTVNSNNLYMQSSAVNELSQERDTITVSYAAIECGCPQWFENKFNDTKFLENVERFYLEPTNKHVTNADSLWDGIHLPLTIKVTGKFSKEKMLPTTYNTKVTPEKARIFWYDELVIISPSH